MRASDGWFFRRCDSCVRLRWCSRHYHAWLCKTCVEGIETALAEDR